MQSQQEALQNRQDQLEQQMQDNREASDQRFEQGFRQLLAQLTMLMNHMAILQ